MLEPGKSESTPTLVWGHCPLALRIPPSLIHHLNEAVSICLFYIISKAQIKKLAEMRLPWWCNGQESACQCVGHGFNPWSGRIPHVEEQLSPWITTTEACALWGQEKPPQREGHILQ